MSWLLDDATCRDDVLGMHEGLAADHGKVFDAVWAGCVDARILEFCRLRTATLLGNTHAWNEPRSAAAVAAGLDEQMVESLAQWPTDDRFDAATKSCIAFAEQYVIDIHGVTDEQVHDLATAIGNDGVVTLTTALAAWEITHRFDNSLLGTAPTNDSTGAF